MTSPIVEPRAVRLSRRVSPPDSVQRLRPFLKWAGGKRQLLAWLRGFYPERFGSYFEPFVGSGAVFFDLHNHGLLRDRPAVLIDNNADLIGCYLAVRDQVGHVIRHLRRLAAAHHKNPMRCYYRVRDDRFNPVRKRILNGEQSRATYYTPALAAMLIYLNRTGFNGLFRLNSKGSFNVPAGRYTNPQICDAENLRRVAAALAGPCVEILQGGCEVVVDQANPGDFVYFDPPYAPLSRTALFTSYTATGFSSKEQQRLQRVVFELASRGCQVLISNSTAPEIVALYDDNKEARAAGLRAYKVPARRSINSNAAGRGEIHEYLITNITRRQ